MLKKLLENLKGKTQEEIINELMNNNEIGVGVKNLVYFYLFPRKLLDRELPGRIREYRSWYNSPTGFLIPDIGESGLLIEAYKTQQYNRFMRHLFYSFSNPDLVHPISGMGTDKCCLCDREISQYDLWNSIYKSQPREIEEKRNLSFGSDDSGLTICLPCLIQLLNAKEILESFEPGFLSPKLTNCSSENLKV